MGEKLKIFLYPINKFIKAIFLPLGIFFDHLNHMNAAFSNPLGCGAQIMDPSDKQFRVSEY